MNICHICLCGYFNEGFGYQDNFMVEENVLSGHNVTIVASQYQMENNGEVVKTNKNEKKVKEGAYIYRIPFKFRNSIINNKLRIYNNLYETLEKIKPEIIFLHGLQFLSLREVIKYKKNYPSVMLYADNHSSFHNSANNIFSNYILHKTIYRINIKNSEKYIEKFFNVTFDCEKFFIQQYGVHKKLEFLPLCGQYIKDSKYYKYRDEKREELNIEPDEKLFIHAGKLEKEKKTIETLKTFVDRDSILIIIGSVNKNIEKDFFSIVKNNKNIIYLGWKSSEELIKYLCASDVFIQIGSQSILFQQAISCRNMVILDKNINTEFLVSWKNGILVESQKELNNVLNNIEDNNISVDEMKERSNSFAHKELNYLSQSKQYIGIDKSDKKNIK